MTVAYAILLTLLWVVWLLLVADLASIGFMGEFIFSEDPASVLARTAILIVITIYLESKIE